MGNDTADLVNVYNTHPFETVSEVKLRRLVDALLREEARSDSQISVVLCEREEHAELHRRYLGQEFPTDVLAFSMDDTDILEGEVYVDLDTARERHREFDSSFESEVARYVIHGVLHLLGFDDHDPTRRATMKEKEEEFVARFEGQTS